MALTRDQILAAQDIETREIEVPEWGGTVKVRALSIKEGNDWRRGMLKLVPKTDQKTKGVSWDYVFDERLAELSTVRMVAIACVDDQGKPLFTEKDVDALSQKSAAPFTRIVKVVKEISGLADTSDEDAGKNSEPNPNDGSSSE